MHSLFETVILNDLKEQGYEDPVAELKRQRIEQQERTAIRKRKLQDLRKAYAALPYAIQASIQRSLVVRDLLPFLDNDTFNRSTIKPRASALKKVLNWTSTRYNPVKKDQAVTAILQGLHDIGEAQHLTFECGATYTEGEGFKGGRRFTIKGNRFQGDTYHFFMIDDAPYLVAEKQKLIFDFIGFDYPETHELDDKALAIEDKYRKDLSDAHKDSGFYQ